MAPRKRKNHEESTVVVFYDEDPLDHDVTTTVVDTVSADGRRTARREHTVYVPAVPQPRGPTRPRYDAPDHALGSAYPAGDEEDPVFIQLPTARKGRAKNLYFLSTVRC